MHAPPAPSPVDIVEPVTLAGVCVTSIFIRVPLPRHILAHEPLTTRHRTSHPVIGIIDTLDRFPVTRTRGAPGWVFHSFNHHTKTAARPTIKIASAILIILIPFDVVH